jgi:FkbM family methyltransferase
VKLHRRIAALFGYELIKKRKLNDTLEQHLGNLLDLLEINCVIDVGANKGQYGQMLRRCGYVGRIVSFEPLADAYAELVKVSRDDADWQAHNVALGREGTVRTINRLASSDFSSFLEPNSYAVERFKWRVDVTERRDVQIVTLASVWADAAKGIAQPRAFLKLDTQGFDLEVLEGASDVLDCVVGIQSEISTKPIYKDMPGYLRSLTEFDRRGFEVTGLYPVTRAKESLALIELDCVMRRRTTPQPSSSA